jgi:hypothetical protein
MAGLCRIIPFAGMAGLCRIIPFMALGPMSYYLGPGPFPDEWVHLFLGRCSETPSYGQAPLRGAGD